MTDIDIVFLDAGTISPTVTMPTPAFPHRWTQYARTEAHDRAARLREADCVLTNKVPIDAALLAACPKLRYVGVVATGTNIVDIPACEARGVSVTNVKGYSTQGVAEHALMMMLSLVKQLKAYQQTISEGAWQQAKQFVYYQGRIDNLHGKTLGLVGTGEIARATAQLCGALGMKVLYHSPSGRKQVEGQDCVSLDTLLQQSDVVSLHCPLTAQTEGLMSAEALAKMKPGALLINTARGPIVDSNAVVDALQRGHLGGAGLDVLPQEPPAAEDVVMRANTLPNLLLTPHTAWASEISQQALVQGVIANVNQWYAQTHGNA